ncbi:MAG: ABC transporter permease [Velocimicrobium sp.]
MFFELIRKNSKKNRKENGLFFVSLIVSIVAFYIILSLKNQDVIIFLQKMESDAVNKLFTLIPVLYAVSLFILFFLVYFAGKYQLDRRSHEFGMYLMMGMRRTRLFCLLLAEEVWSSILSLTVGIPIAIFLSEMISLITARLVGLDIIGHHTTFSAQAVLWTFIGYFTIRLVTLVILSGTFVKKEIGQMLSENQDKIQKLPNRGYAIIQLILGIVFTTIAYGMAIVGMAWSSISQMGITVILGICGTFLLFHGIGISFEILLNKKENKKGLGIFTFRQLQETVFSKSNSLAVSSLLLLMALCCFGYGVSVGFGSNAREKRVMDYTFQGEEQQIKMELNKTQAAQYLEELFEVKTGQIFVEKGDKHNFSAKSLIEAVESQKNSNDKDILLNNLMYFTYPYLISQTGYNHILGLVGKDTLQLKGHQVALYNDPDFSYGKTDEMIQNVLQGNLYIEIDDEKYQLTKTFCQDNIVTDRSITISYGLVVPDDVFNRLTKGQYTSYWNARLKKDIVEKNGLMQSITQVNTLLEQTQLEYESYLQNMGRNLFYMVAASYITIYLAIIFLIIANTVIGVQFLIQQQKTGKRYRTLIRLGCHYTHLCQSAREQIKWYFGLPVAVAAIGSLFGVKSLFSGIVPLERQGEVSTLFIIAVPMLAVLCMVELIYIFTVMKLSDRHLQELMDGRREDN